jgi:hypothetical protein
MVVVLVLDVAPRRVKTNVLVCFEVLSKLFNVFKALFALCFLLLVSNALHKVLEEFFTVPFIDQLEAWVVLDAL